MFCHLQSSLHPHKLQLLLDTPTDTPTDTRIHRLYFFFLIFIIVEEVVWKRGKRIRVRFNVMSAQINKLFVKYTVYYTGVPS